MLDTLLFAIDGYDDDPRELAPRHFGGSPFVNQRQAGK
jgi:hypothetical protein